MTHWKFKKFDDEMWREKRLLFFADKKEGKEEGEKKESKEKKKGITVLPTKPSDDATKDDWIDYEKELAEHKKKVEDEMKDRDGLGIGIDDLKKLLKKVERASKAARQEIEKREVNSYEDGEVAFERAASEHDNLVAQNRLNIRRFLKNYSILDKRERTEGLDDIYEGWEEDLYSVHYLDQDIGALREGRRLYAGGKTTSSNKIITDLESALQQDQADFEDSKYQMSEEKRNEIKADLKKREQKIKDLKKKDQEEFFAAVDKYIEELETKRHKLKMGVVKKMIKEFDGRLNRLIRIWENPPEEYQFHQEATLRRLRNQKEVLDDFKKIALIENPVERHRQMKEKFDMDDFTDEDLKALRQFDIHLDNSELRSSEKGKHLIAQESGYAVKEIGELEEEYKKLQERAEEAVETVGFITENRPLVLKQFQDALVRLKETDIEDFAGDTKQQKEASRMANIKSVEESILNLESDTLTKKAFDSEWGKIDAELKNNFSDVAGEKNETYKKAKLKTLADNLHTAKEYFQVIIDSKNGIESSKKALNGFVHRHGEVSHERATKDIVQVEVNFLNGSDIYRIYEKVMEFAKRRWDRASDDRIGTVGSKLFDNIPNVLGGRMLKQLGNEFDKQKEDAEQTEVDQYKGALLNKDAWQIQEVLENTTNVDEFKAAIAALSEIGRMRFDNPKMWRQLERFQSEVKIMSLPYTEKNIIDMQGSSAELHDRIHKAMGYIWDFDTYYDFKNENDNNYESKKQAHFKRCDQTAETELGLTGRLKIMLTQHKKSLSLGQGSQTNPHEYEAIIEYSIKQGKMDPEDATYFIIQGIKHGILEWPDRINHFDSTWLNDYPVLEVFTGAPGGDSPARKATWSEIEEWSKIDADKNAPGQDFRTWFWTYASHRSRVLQRYDKTLTQGSNRMDHDYLTVAFSFGDASTIKNMLQKTAGTEHGAPATGMMNGLVSYLKYLDNWAINRDTVLNSNHQISRMVGSFLTFDLITSRRMYTNKNYFTWTETQLDDPFGPRYAGQYRTHQGKRGVKTARQFIEKIRSHLFTLDQDLFKMLYDKPLMSSKDGVKRVVDYLNTNYPGALEEPMPTKADQIYDQITQIIDAVVSGRKGKSSMDNLQNHVRTDIKDKVGADAVRSLHDIYRENSILQPDLAEITAGNKKLHGGDDADQQQQVKIMDFPDTEGGISGLESGGGSPTQLNA